MLLGACDADTIARPAAAPSLLEPATSPTRKLAAAVEEALAHDVPVIGVSLVLDHPRLTGRYRGYPWSAGQRPQRCAIAAPFAPEHASRRRPSPRAAGTWTGAPGGGGARRPSVRGACGGSATRDRAPRSAPGRAARHDSRAAAVAGAPPAASAAEPGDGGRNGARPRAAPLARAVAAARGRHGRPHARSAPGLRPRPAGTFPRALPGAQRRPRARSRRAQRGPAPARTHASSPPTARGAAPTRCSRSWTGNPPPPCCAGPDG